MNRTRSGRRAAYAAVAVAFVALSVAGAAAGLAGPLGRAGGGVQEVDRRSVAVDDFVVPQRFNHGGRHGSAVRVERVAVEVSLGRDIATTEYAVTLRNTRGRAVETSVLIPVPEGSAVSNFSLDGVGDEPTARVLPREEARRLYREIVSRMIDPGLLEFEGHAAVRSSVFPVPANGTATFRLRFDNALGSSGGRREYVLPRSNDSMAGPDWAITVRAADGVRLHSLTHGLERLPDGSVVVKPGNAGDVRIGVDGGEGTPTVYTYADPSIGGGRFAVVLSDRLAGELSAARADRLRSVTLVLDTSGSMGGAKIDQAKDAAQQIINSLSDEESFNIVAFSSEVRPLFDGPRRAGDEARREARAFIETLRAAGGTNIRDALVTALSAEAPDDALGVVLFLTDGLPTVGVTSEAQIKRDALSTNDAARVFSFGVGDDVNVALLNGVSQATRGIASFVRPGESVEVAVTEVEGRLRGPRLTSLELSGRGGEVYQVMPSPTPDLFRDDQIVLAGTYRGEGPISLRLRAEANGEPVEIDLGTIVPSAATVRDGFVARLWAQRRIASLTEEIRQGTAEDGSDIGERFGEQIDEIIRISTRYGVLSEYTAFLVTEPELRLSDAEAVRERTVRNYAARNVQSRTGGAAVAQQSADNRMNYDMAPAPGDALLSVDTRAEADAQRARGGVSAYQRLQVINDIAFVERDGRWVDTRIVDGTEPARSAGPGDAGFARLIDALSAMNRVGVTALPGDVLTLIDGEAVLIRRGEGR